ncbi:hypothetical protein JR316_0007934 [Psilocybe cubensis]|nr:hypothetical protein JR316_0007934 [Psilocybe cubensis]KAH9479344.1 hypothetical protein JR316_0007934 [Psilocybe cubensis]
MATMLETPSRIWRRIEAIEDEDMPSLPSLPPFEHSGIIEETTREPSDQPDSDDQFDEDFESETSPLQSTPASTQHTITSALRAPSSTSSTARFAHSIASRSNRSVNNMTASRGMSSRRSHHDSFDIPSLPRIQPNSAPTTRQDESDGGEEESKSSVPEVYLPPEGDADDHEQEYSLTDALQSISRSSTPPISAQVGRENTPKKNYDYSVSLKSEPKASPFEKYRNVALRRTNPTSARIRTPSLSRTSSSQTTSPANSTPQSNRSGQLPRSQTASPISARGIPLPRSTTASPATHIRSPEGDEDQSIEAPNFSNDTNDNSARSMDITDVHVSPPRVDGEDGQTTEESESQQESHQDLGTYTEGSHDGHEPTFSSEGEPTPHANNSATAQNKSAFSSPSQSVAFTPTPAFPRPRARFDLPPPPSDLLTTPASRNPEEDEDYEPHGDLLTPHTRRRSFLLSVINSTARPRMKVPTPHPKRFGSPLASAEESTPGPSSSASPGTSLQSAFAGVTPRPRMAVVRRMSHPLSQAVTASSGSSDGARNPASWTTPAQASPYDGVADRASFISTASSHDLTTHQRANTSFDPAMGFGSGAPGHGVGRFNAGKLNTYLHGLNRRLQEENEILIEKMRKMEEEKKTEPSSSSAPGDTSRRLSAASRRASGVGTSLANVQDVPEEGWLEEKAELEDMVEAFKIEVTNCMAEKEEVEQALEREKAERERDIVRWKERMSEVEQGVSGIVQGLEQKVIEAEERVKTVEQEAERRIKDVEKALAEAQGERDVATERASKAERVLESGKELGGALKEANDRVAQVMGDLRNANAQIKELEDEVMHSDARIDELEKEAKEDKEIISGLETELTSTSDALAAERAKSKQLEDTIRRLDEELRSTKAYVDELEEGAGDAMQKIEQLEGELELAKENMKVMATSEEQASQDVKSLQNELIKAQETARQMEDALEDAEQKMMKDEEALAELRSKVATLERERQREASNTSRDVSRGPVEAGPTEEEYQELEKELDDAEREIARLNALLNQSPARKAMDKAKDTKIELLEREKEELLERNRALRMTFNEMHTPNKLINASGISPIHRQVLSMSIRAPRTPGGPLRDMSWLHTANSETSVTPLVSEINRLQGELDRANESIDDKLDKLEDAGMGVVGLTKKLEDARAKIVTLEDEIARLSRKEDRRVRSLARVRCQNCDVKVDLRHLTKDNDNSLDVHEDQLLAQPPTKTSEALKANLESVNKHLEELKSQWEAEKRVLLGEKAVLEDAANRLNSQVKNTKEEARKIAEQTRAGEKLRANVENELERAKRTISVLENELGSERARLRSMVTEQERIQREKKQILTDLTRTESDMEEVKQQLQRFKKENHELEKELRENANIEQKARLLETRVVENAETIEQLRQERALLAADHKELQRRFAEASETANNLRNEYVAHSTSHDNRRHELDLHRLEIEDLRRALDERVTDLHRVEKEKEKIASEKSDVARTVASLEADLRRVRKDAEAFGHDLRQLRGEKERLEVKSKEELSKAERAKKQMQTQIRLLTEQLDGQKEKTLHALDQLKSHVCSADATQLSELKLRHNKECKGLMVQIRYLKAKCTRESSFRDGLTYQKKYLLELLAAFEKSERTIFASIARIGFPVANPPPKRKVHKLKSVARMVIFLSRIR